MEPVVHFRAAVSLLGRFPALAGVDLDVAGRDRARCRVPNGAGKTTLLRACAGLVPVVVGHARVLGHDLTARRGARCGRRSGSSATPPASTTTSRWPTTSASGPGPPAPDQPRPTRPWPASGSTAGCVDVAVARLSAGQRRRTSLAALVARRPRAVAARRAPRRPRPGRPRRCVDGLIRDAVAAGATVVLASHELDRARRRRATGRSPIAGGTSSTHRSAARRRQPPPPARCVAHVP